MAACAIGTTEQQGQLQALMPEQLHELVFNSPTPVHRAEVSLVSHYDFYYELTDEQLNAVFPPLNINLDAQALYTDDGFLVEISAYTPYADNDPHRLRIRVGVEKLGSEWSVFWFGENYEPTISDVHGISVTAYMIDDWDDWNDFQAEFMLGNLAYRIRFNDYTEAGQARMTEIVNRIILGEPADLSSFANPVIPEQFSYELTLDEARLDPIFGGYVPSVLPAGFINPWVYRSKRQYENGLYMRWEKPFEHDYLYDIYTRWSADRTSDRGLYSFDQIHWGENTIQWYITEATEYDLERIVSVNEREKYEWSLYPIVQHPDDLRKFHAIPDEDYIIFHEPVFKAEDLSLEIIQAREWTRVWIIQGADGTNNMMNTFIPIERSEIAFSVLYNNIIINIKTEGLSAEQVWAMILK
jgi:hypothetical protein